MCRCDLLFCFGVVCLVLNWLSCGLVKALEQPALHGLKSCDASCRGSVAVLRWVDQQLFVILCCVR